MTPETPASYIAFFETIAPDTLDQIDTLCTETVLFQDPFSTITGREPLKEVFADMFRRLHEPRFVVRDKALSGDICYLRWTFHFQGKPGGRPWEIEGMSEVHFTEGGLVSAHIDHWDSGRQFYARLPIIGWFIRRIAARVGHG